MQEIFHDSSTRIHIIVFHICGNCRKASHNLYLSYFSCVYNDGKASVDIHCFPLFHKIQDSTLSVSPFFPYGKLWKVEKLLYLSCLKHVFLWITYVCKRNPPEILQKTCPVRWKTESVFSFTFHKQIISIFST